MDLAELVAGIRREQHGVLATLGPRGSPHAATVGFAVTDGLELVLDTLETTRKAQNIRRDARVAAVITVGAETYQLEGRADEPTGAERERLVAVYLTTFPDGITRQSWPGLTYIRVSVDWLRYTDFRGAEPLIVERRFRHQE